jgi:hypothetical protein
MLLPKHRNYAESHSYSAAKNCHKAGHELPLLQSDIEWQVLSLGVQNPQNSRRANEGYNTN